MTCDCPAAAALVDIPEITCPENFGQIQKVAFQRLKGDKGKENTFTSLEDIKLLASWTKLLSASDGTKVVVSPYIQAPTNEPNEPITFGGGNETLGGIPITIGSNPSPFTAVIRSAPQNIIAAMKQLQCDAEAGNLGVYLFNAAGQIGCVKDEEEPTTFKPIPIRSLFISDKNFGGLEAPDGNNIQWSFLPDWSDNFSVVAPTDFNPLTDLVKAA